MAVIFSGLGRENGTEITEAVSVLIALSELNVATEFFAPEVNSAPLEASKITRRRVQPLQQLNVNEFDGLVFPGGMGAASVLSNWADKKSQGEVRSDVQKVIREFHQEQKPILAICIAPNLLALTFKNQGTTLTLGSDPEVMNELKRTGNHAEACAVTDFVSDRENRLITTPAYMYDNATPFEVFEGIRLACRELVEMA